MQSGGLFVLSSALFFLSLAFFLSRCSYGTDLGLRWYNVSFKVFQSTKITLKGLQSWRNALGETDPLLTLERARKWIKRGWPELRWIRKSWSRQSRGAAERWLTTTSRVVWGNRTDCVAFLTSPLSALRRAEGGGEGLKNERDKRRLGLWVCRLPYCFCQTRPNWATAVAHLLLVALRLTGR